ncbi:unnamed protein product [Brassica oleracea var. botrytis]
MIPKHLFDPGSTLLRVIVDFFFLFKHISQESKRSKKMMKRPIKEVYGSDASDGFNKGKTETVERYRALLPNSIASQIELLEEIIKAKGKFDFTAELEKLKEELMEADGMLADVKVKVPDWCKLEEKWLLDE